MWKFKSELGMMKKTIQLKVEITNWLEPNKVTFDLKSENENCMEMDILKPFNVPNNKTNMAGFIELTACGTWAKMVNPLLKIIYLL